MIKCTLCGKKIVKGSRYYKGKNGGIYHIYCGSGLKYKKLRWVK